MGAGTTEGLDAGHDCYGCRKPVGDGEPHIHVPMDEWAAGEGMGALGLDDLLTFAFCEPCTITTRRTGWQLESHAIPRGA